MVWRSGRAANCRRVLALKDRGRLRTIRMPERHEQSAVAMRLDEPAATRPWYLGATPSATLRWLIRLRWATAAIEGTLLAIVWGIPSLDLPLDHMALILLVAAVNNIAVARRLSHGHAVPSPAAAAGLAVEVLLLTGLLELTGGPLNPFTVVYAIQVTLAALTLGAWWASFVGGVGTIAYGVLLYWHTRELVPGHHRLNDVPTHLFTLWIAGAVTAELVAYFIVRASDALRRREQELDVMRLQAARSERLVSLTTLTAGAAHELSTPLATIAVAARELEHAASARGTVPDLAEDARLIRREVDRCQAILDQMSGRAGGTATDDMDVVDLPVVFAEIRRRLAPDQLRRFEVHLPAPFRVVVLPQMGLTQAIHSLVKNAFDASADNDVPVTVSVVHELDRLCVTVRDRGAGMTSDASLRAGEPFFTTKQPGRGLGLGLFLTRVFAERLGGTLTLQSADGTTAILELPQPSAHIGVP